MSDLQPRTPKPSQAAFHMELIMKASNVIDITTGRPIDLTDRQQRDQAPIEDRSAALQIVSWHDTCVRDRGIAEVKGCALVGGIIPIELAGKFLAMCGEWNAAV